MTLTLVAWGCAAQAQTLAEHLDAAAKANADAQVSEKNRERAELEFAQAWGGLLPTLTASGGWTHNQYDAVLTLPTGATTSETVTIIPKDQLDATLKAELPLIDASKWLRTAASSSSAEAARQRDRSTRTQVQRQVVTAFHSYVAAQAVLQSAQRSLGLARAQLDVTKARAEAGVANELELVRGQAEVDRNHQLVANAEALVATGARSLETLSGLAPKQAPALPVDPLEPPPPLAELEAGVPSLGVVQAAEADVDAAQRTSTAASLALVPTVSAQFTQRFTNATGFQGQSALYNAGLNFSWRLDVPAVQALRAQHVAEATSLITAERTRRAAADQLFSDWHQLQAELKKVQAARSQVVAARRAVALTHERSSAGVATQLDVIQAERDLFAAEVADIQAEAGLASARALLSLSAGRPVEAP